MFFCRNSPTRVFEDLPQLFSKMALNFVWQMIAGKRHDYETGELLKILSLLKETNEVGHTLLTGPVSLSPLFE
jgi:hypothetical protein